MTLPLAAASGSVLVAIAILFVLGIAAQWLAWRLRLPSILLLLIFGFAAGRLGFVDADFLLDDHLFGVVALSVGLILFEGGLSLRLPELGEAAPVVWKLVTLGALVTWVLAGVGAWFILDFEPGMAALFGAILIVSGPTVVLPLLHLIKPRGPVSNVLKWEGIVIDPVGAVMALLVYEGLLGGHVSDVGPFLAGIGKTLFAGVVCGAGGAAILYAMLKRFLIPDHLHVAFTLAIVVAAFVGSNAMQHESGLLAVTLLGILMANQRSVSVHHILEFKENLRVLLISFLFLLLSSRLDMNDLALFDGRSAIFLAVLLFIVRPAATYVCTINSSLNTKERIFLSWLCPRGIVAAAVASVFALGLSDKGIDGAQRLVAETFFVIVGTVVVYGLTAPILARKLGLSVPDPQGVLIVGAQSWARELACALQNEEFDVVVADTNRQNVRAARAAGLHAIHTNVLDENEEDHVELGGVGRVLAMTANDGVNRLVMQHYLHEFGRRELYRLKVHTEDVQATGEGGPGRVVFGTEGSTFASLNQFASAGGTIQSVALSEAMTYEAFLESKDEAAIVLAFVTPNRKLRLNTTDLGAMTAEPKTVITFTPTGPG